MKTDDFYTIQINEKNRHLFFAAEDEGLSGEPYFWIGAVDRKNDTACGSLGIEYIEEEGGKALAIRLLSVPEEYRGRGVEEVLLRQLFELAEVGSVGAIYDTELVRDQEENPLFQLLLDLGFFEEEEKLGLYEFQLKNVSVMDEKSGLGCLRLKELSGEQWREFREEAESDSFRIMERDYYDANLSIFLVDDENSVQAGILLRIREGILFAEKIAAYGSDEEALLNDLILWASDGAKKRLPPDTRVNVFLPSGSAYFPLFMEATRKKGEKAGHLVNLTYEVPVTGGLKLEP